MLIVPPPLPHTRELSLVRQGCPPTRIPGFMGVQVPAGTSAQGWGVSTPMAAAVAAATWGFASEVHIPKGVMQDGCAS